MLKVKITLFSIGQSIDMQILLFLEFVFKINCLFFNNKYVKTNRLLNIFPRIVTLCNYPVDVEVNSHLPPSELSISFSRILNAFCQKKLDAGEINEITKNI